MNTMGLKHQHKHCANPILAQNGPCVHLFEVVPPQVTDGLHSGHSANQYWDVLKAAGRAACTVSSAAAGRHCRKQLVNKRKSGGIL